MFTLNLPINLPGEYYFFENDQHPVPALPGGLTLKSHNNEEGPLILRVSSFATEQGAIDYCTELRTALRVAALKSQHSITPSNAPPVISRKQHFDGNKPTVTQTDPEALPYVATSSIRNGLHLAILSTWISEALSNGSLPRVAQMPKLALALELYSDCQFAGEANAQFIVLMTALEVLLPDQAKSKRGAAIALVKKALSTSGHGDPKAAGKELDRLYVARNALLHEGKSVAVSDLPVLKDIVRATLKALVSGTA